jgi:hypothetical protein
MIPGYTLEALKRYRDHHVPVGDFLTAVLENNLMEAFGRADENNSEAMKDILIFVRWEMPGDCHGSPERVAAWIEKGREERCSESSQSPACSADSESSSSPQP